MSAVKQQWGRSIKEQRIALGKSQVWLAEQVGVDQSSVSFWEHGLRAPSVEKQLLISKALHVHPHVLFQFPAVA